MGFMAGFGPSFARSFEQGNERHAQEKQDLFRLTYNDFVSQREKYDNYKREDAKYASKAAAMIEGSNVDPAALPKVVEWVKAGVDDATIEKRLINGKFTVNQNIEAPDAPGSVEKQTGAAMTPEVGAPVPTASIAANQDAGMSREVDTGNPITDFIKRQSRGGAQRRQDGAIDKVASTSGTTSDEVRKTLKGYESPTTDTSNITFDPGAPERDPDKFANPNEAYIEKTQAHDAATQNPTPENVERARQADLRVKAINDRIFIEADAKAMSEGKSRDGSQITIWKGNKYSESGQLVLGQDGTESIATAEGIRPLAPDEQARRMTPEELDFRKQINSSTQKERENVRIQRQAAQSAFSTLNVMHRTIRDTHGEVLSGGVASVTSKLENWTIQAAVAAKKLNEAFATTGEGEEVQGATQETFNTLLAAEKALLAADKTDLGSQKLLYDTQKAILAYRLGAMMGQEGRGLQEAERKLFAGVASAGVTVDQFYDGMANLMMPIVKGIDNGGQAIYKSAADQFTAQFPYTPGEFEYTPLAQELANNPESAPLYQEFTKRDRSGPAQIIDTSGGDSANQPAVPQYPKPAPGAVEMLKSNPALKASFDQRYGPGTADKVLGGM